MCLQIIECYASCRCTYHVHAVDPCSHVGRSGHLTSVKTVLTGFVCPRHGTAFKGRHDGASSTVSDSSGQGSEAQSSGQDSFETQRLPLVSPLREDPRGIIVKSKSQQRKSQFLVSAEHSISERDRDMQPALEQNDIEQIKDAKEIDQVQALHQSPGENLKKDAGDREQGEFHKKPTRNEMIDLDEKLKQLLSRRPIRDPPQVKKFVQSPTHDRAPIKPRMLWKDRRSNLGTYASVHPFDAFISEMFNVFSGIARLLIMSTLPLTWAVATSMMMLTSKIPITLFKWVDAIVLACKLMLDFHICMLVLNIEKRYYIRHKVNSSVPVALSYIETRMSELPMLCQMWLEKIELIGFATCIASNNCSYYVKSNRVLSGKEFKFWQPQLSAMIAKSSLSGLLDYSDNIGNGLVAASFRSLGYTIKSLSVSPTLCDGHTTVCKCGQMHALSLNHARSKQSTTFNVYAKSGRVSIIKCWNNDQHITSASPQHENSTPRASSLQSITTQANSSTTSTVTPFGGMSDSNSLQQSPVPIYTTQSTSVTASQSLRFLLLGVNVSKHGIRPQHVVVNSVLNDLDLMTAIRRGYNKARGGRPWHVFQSFHQPTCFNLTKFCLVPRRTDTRLGVLEVPSIPPIDEVKVHNRYHYCTCIEPNGPPYLPMNTAFLDAFFDPVEHTTRFWIDHLPKKLNEPLIYDPDSGTLVGWGIHIVEGPNLLLFSIIMSIFLFIVTILCVIWVVVLGGNVSDAFTVGSFILGLCAAVCTTVYYYWQQKGTAQE